MLQPQKMPLFLPLLLSQVESTGTRMLCPAEGASVEKRAVARQFSKSGNIPLKWLKMIHPQPNFCRLGKMREEVAVLCLVVCVCV